MESPRDPHHHQPSQFADTCDGKRARRCRRDIPRPANHCLPFEVITTNHYWASPLHLPPMVPSAVPRSDSASGDTTHKTTNFLNSVAPQHVLG